MTRRHHARSVMLLAALVLLARPAPAIGQQITEEEIDRDCSTYPNSFWTLREAIVDLAPMGAEAQQMAVRSIARENLAGDDRFHLICFAKSYLNIVHADACFSDAQLSQEGARMKLGVTNRIEVLELILASQALMKKLHLNDQILYRLSPVSMN